MPKRGELPSKAIRGTAPLQPQTRRGVGAPGNNTISTLPPSPPNPPARAPTAAADSAARPTSAPDLPAPGICFRYLPRARIGPLRLPPLLLSFLGGAVFLAIFSAAYDRIPYETYAVRDDGVITTSHAKNWVDYGFIGVNPSGPRVEGHSAPVQFFLYAALYRLFALRYDTYANLQTLAASFLLGALFIRFFRDRPVGALALTAFAAFLLTKMGSFFLWHGSGLENAITHVLFLAAAYLLYRFVETGRIRMAYAPVVFLATVSRLDSVFHVAPPLLLFATTWRVSRKNYAGFAFGGLVLALWAAFQGWRYLYFGDLTPNTAYANFISVPDYLVRLLHGDLDHLRDALRFGQQLLLRHGGILLAAASFSLYCLRKRSYGGGGALLAASTALLATACLHPFVFGETRLDPTRSTTHLALFSVLAVACLLDLALRTGRLLPRSAALLAATACVLLLPTDPSWARRPICCDTAILDPTRLELLRVARRHDLPRATVATPDLGVLSWHKNFNVVDLGRIGSPLIAKTYNSPILNDYFFDHIAPDLLAIHDTLYPAYRQSLLGDPRFTERYEPIRTGSSILRFVGTEIPSGPSVPQRFWIREAVRPGSDSEERKLIEELRARPSAEVLRAALLRCSSPGGEGCRHVARTAYRFLPELSRRGEAGQVQRLFASGTASALDRYLVEGPRGTSLRDPAFRELAERRLARTLPQLSSRRLFARSVFDLYVVGNDVIYHKEDCQLDDRLQPFFLRGVLQFSGTASRPGLRDAERLKRAPDRYFRFRDIGFQLGDRCLGVLSLGSARRILVQTGQLDWQRRIRWIETGSARLEPFPADSP